LQNDAAKLDGCIVWNAHSTVLGEEALLIYIIRVRYVKQVSMKRPSNIIINLHRKKFSIITNIPLVIRIVTISVTINSLEVEQ